MTPTPIKNIINPQICPDNIAITKNTVKKAVPNLLSISFLFGIISSKWYISHSRKRIRVHLPISKKYIAEVLLLQFGGTMHISKLPKHQGVVWQITSDKSLKKIKEAALRVRAGLPKEFRAQLAAFLSAFNLH